MSMIINSQLDFMRQVKRGVLIRNKIIMTQFDQGFATAAIIEDYRLKLMMIMYDIARMIDELRRHQNIQPVSREILADSLSMFARLIVSSCARFNIQCNLKNQNSGCIPTR